MFQVQIRDLKNESHFHYCKSFETRPNTFGNEIYQVILYGTEILNKQFPHRSDVGEVHYTRDRIFVKERK